MGNYDTGTDFFRDMASSYGLDEAIGMGERYLSTQLRSDSSEENRFCHELFIAMYEATAGKADPSKLVYPYTFDEADERGEKETYRANRRLNEECAQAIDTTISNSCYDTHHYNLRGASQIVVQEYGFQRVNLVLAANISSRMYDGRFSSSNKDWATALIEPEKASPYAVLNAHPVLLDSFTYMVRDLYQELDAERFRLPGQPESGHEVSRYEIIRAIQFDNDRGFALGHNPNAGQPLATWQFKAENGQRDFFWGRYFNDMQSAQDSYVARVAVYMRDERVEERTSPIAAEEMDTEQNYSMIDGVRNNISPEEPPSVREQLRRAQQEPQPPSRPRPDRERDELER